jgi:protein SEY1
LIPLYAKISPVDTSNEYILPMESRDTFNNETALDEEIDFEASLVIFTETKSLELANRFRKDADAYYVEAKRSTVATMAQIPYWIYLALVVLGWNEAMAILFNPLYLTLTIMALCTA